MIRDFFYLPKSDRLILLLLFAVILVGAGIIYMAGDADDTPQPAAAVADTLATAAPRLSPAQATASEPAGTASVQLRPFDPNTADSALLVSVGLAPWQARNICRYRSRGGIFRQKEDFAKVYGLTVKQYRQLAPYIRIGRDYQPAATLVAPRRQEHDALPAPDTMVRRRKYPVKIGTTETIVLNTADTALLRHVPGIGPYYASEIVRYGRRLGGYVSVDQLDEISDFPQKSKRYFTISGATPAKLNVNQLSIEKLRRHPYINYYMAKAIVDYRRLYGPLKSLDDLKLHKEFTPQVIERLRPYVEF